ncbi:MAG TPA: hypothetical protein VF695_03475 [Sphingomonas sp.]|jgi:hypothetical protein
MKISLPLTLAAILSLAACNQPEPEVVEVNPDPMAAELANRPAVALPPAIRAEKSFRCDDNSLVYVTFFQGDTQVNVRLVQGGPPTVLRAPAAGEPYVAEGGWSLTGDDNKVTIVSPGKPSRTCHL